MSRIYNLIQDENDVRDEIFIDFNKYYDIIEYLIYNYIMEGKDRIPDSKKEYIEYFLNLEELVKYYKSRKCYNFS